MESVIRAAIIYLFLMVIFRLSGKRTLYEATPFDFILVLIIGESVQEVLIGEDNSMTNVFVIVITLVCLDISFSSLRGNRKIRKIIEGTPMLIVDRGNLIEDALKKCRIDKEDILETARESYGLERLEQIKFAVLETNGAITIIPEKK